MNILVARFATTSIRPFLNTPESQLLTLWGLSKLCQYPSLIQKSSDLLTTCSELFSLRTTCYYLDKTIGQIFSAGETQEDLLHTMKSLHIQNLGVIADYCAQGQSTSQAFNQNAQVLLKSLPLCSKFPNSAIAVKLTALAPPSLLQKVTSIQTGDVFHDSLFLEQNREKLKKLLDEQELQSFEQADQRIRKIVQMSVNNGVRVMIDAEQTYYQKAIDAWAVALQLQFNRTYSNVNTTFQCYLVDCPERLESYLDFCKERKIQRGLKLVRGAYIGQQRKLAFENQRVSPIHPSKQECDDCYNRSLVGLLESHKEEFYLCVASHNEQSALLAKKVMKERKIDRKKGGVHFGQLLGMKAQLSAELAQESYATTKYVPYGPVEKLMPYLLRRASEQSEVLKSNTEQIDLIKQELRFRSAANKQIKYQCGLEKFEKNGIQVYFREEVLKRAFILCQNLQGRDRLVIENLGEYEILGKVLKNTFIY